MSFEFGERHFDGIEIGTIRRQEEKPGAPFFQALGCGSAFVSGEVVEDDHIAFLEGWGQLGFNIGVEERPVHRSIDDPGSRQPEAAQARNERLGSPCSKGRRSFQPCPAGTAAPKPAHPRVCGCFVKENKPVGLKLHAGKAGHPGLARLFHIGAFLLGCHQCFFYR